MRRFELGRPDERRTSSWLTSAAIHVTAVVLAVTVAWGAKFMPRAPQPQKVREWVVLPPVPDLTPARRAAPRPQDATELRIAQQVPVAREPLPTPEPMLPPLRTPTTMEHYRGPVVLGPQLGDGRPWVSPRPALPAAMAEALYGGKKDTMLLEEVVQLRLRAMLDTLNKAIDAEQRSGRRPTWATEIAGLPFAMDSQYITIAGIKVPNVALALLGGLLPQGELQTELTDHLKRDMHDDLMRAAARTQNYKDFQNYVKQMRARKQAERDSARARPVAPPLPPPLPPQPSDTVIP